jgi:alpha-galactosidase
VTRLAQKIVAAAGAAERISVSSTTDRRTALPGATVIICTVGVGGRRAWEQDVFIPRTYGISVPVGDTVGPGGSSRALRMIPPMVAIARDVLELAPQALFFNYGNPMAPICRAIHKATGANVIGLCHGVFHVAYELADALGVARDRLRYTAVGYNHLTWFTHVRVDGVDAMPELHRIADEKLAKSATEPHDNVFSWHLLKQFGAFPAVLDRHVTEFFPQFFRDGSYYGRTLGVDAFSFEGTIAWGDREFEEMQRDALGDQLPGDYLERIGGEHEQVIDIVASIRGDIGRIYSANLPNTGQAPNLPPLAIVEGPAIADAQGVRAIAQPPLATALAGALASRYAWVETIVEAALEGSRDTFIQALVLDGYVTSLDQAAALADDLLKAQAAYLPWVK